MIVPQSPLQFSFIPPSSSQGNPPVPRISLLIPSSLAHVQAVSNPSLLSAPLPTGPLGLAERPSRVAGETEPGGRSDLGGRGGRSTASAATRVEAEGRDSPARVRLAKFVTSLDPRRCRARSPGAEWRDWVATWRGKERWRRPLLCVAQSRQVRLSPCAGGGTARGVPEDSDGTTRERRGCLVLRSSHIVAAKTRVGEKKPAVQCAGFLDGQD